MKRNSHHVYLFGNVTEDDQMLNEFLAKNPPWCWSSTQERVFLCRPNLTLVVKKWIWDGPTTLDINQERAESVYHLRYGLR